MARPFLLGKVRFEKKWPDIAKRHEVNSNVTESSDKLRIVGVSLSDTSLEVVEWTPT